MTAIGSTKTSSIGLSVVELPSVTPWSRARTILLDSALRKREMFLLVKLESTHLRLKPLSGDQTISDRGSVAENVLSTLQAAFAPAPESFFQIH
ncbi:hypothetical protein E2542_SST23404 [Spatholobus suberectus]|nr:hypothetical protein E2542_SST23404 [Spatholobus suberectus]